MERITILGVHVDPVTMPEALDRIRALLEDGERHLVVTPNPEMVVEAERNASFRAVLRSASLALPDGAGLLFAARLAGHRLPARITGTDTMSAICASVDCPSLFFLGAAEGIADVVARTMKAQYPDLSVAGTFSGSPGPAWDDVTVECINASGAALLFVAFGAPRQEMWIQRNLSRLTTVRVAMGVGGAFDFFAGKRRRAPRVLQSLHLEWLWRLLQEPSRILRIYTAVVVFPLMVVRDLLRRPQ